MTKLKTLILLLIAVLLLSSCGTIKEELGFGDKAGLSYNDLSISEIDLDADIKALESNKEFSDQFTDETQPFLVKGKLSPDFKAAWVNIQLQILTIKEARLAAKLKITEEDKKEGETNAKAFFAGQDPTKSEAVWKKFNKSFKERFINALAEQAAFSRGVKKPSDKEIKDYYDKLCPSGVDVSHILVATEAEAKTIKKDLDAGGDFAAIATEKSTDTGSGTQGGELGCLTDGQFVAEFEAGAKALAAGQISDPVKTEFGFHIISVKPFATLEEIKDQISEQVANDAKDALYKKIDEKVKKAKIKVSSKYGKVEKTDGIPGIVKNEDDSKTTTTTVPGTVETVVPAT